MGLGLGIGAPGSIKRPRQSQARWTVGLKTGVSLQESLELSDVVEVVSSNNDDSSNLGLDNPFALFWFLNRDFYTVQMDYPRGWILEFILRTSTSRSESKTSIISRTRRSRRRRMWNHDLFLVLVILSPEAPTKHWSPILVSMPKFYLMQKQNWLKPAELVFYGDIESLKGMSTAAEPGKADIGLKVHYLTNFF